ncbi:MAG: fucose isomerase [Oscillospiraceae bacterium]
MITKAADVKLKVLPVLAQAEHLYYYEGPCRFGYGEALQPGYDALANAQKAEIFLSKVKACCSEGIELMEPVYLRRTDDWDNHEAMWEAAAPSARECDIAVCMQGIACDDLIMEFGERFKKPIATTPLSGFSGTITVATMQAKSANYEAYGFYKWEDLAKTLRTLRARKIINTTRILCITRFGNPTSYSSVDSFNSYEAITSKLGVRFRFLNLHEFFDQMSPAVEGGNPTTPGRKTPDLDEKDLKEAEALTGALMSGAAECTMEREKVLKSAIAYVMVKKNMDLKDCCGFTAPCPDACSTRRLNEIGFTFCLTHSLNMEQGIPSACEYDVDAVLSQQALIAVSGKCPYMGNTCPVPVEDGKLQMRFGMTEEQVEKLSADPENLYMMQHSVAHRRIKDAGKDSPYALRNFAIDQGFGATLRYDFDADAGQKLTFCRFSPDGSKLFIGSGEVVMGGGYGGNNCSQLVYFRVKDQAKTWKAQCNAGNHCTMVYGDYVQELTDLAVALGVEPVVAD